MTQPTTTPRPVIVVLRTSTRGEDVNLYTDLIAAAVHDEGAMIRTGGHNYPVEVASAPYAAPDTTSPTHAATARGVALMDVYRAALDPSVTEAPTTHQIAQAVADLLHLADASGDSDARDVLDTAHAYHATHTPENAPRV